VEQDLVLSRALVEMFNHQVVAEQAVFRGGTALHKLYLGSAGRYSEDIDLVQRTAQPIGDLVNSIRETLDPWLGKPKWKAGHGRFTLYYRFETTSEPVSARRLKVEINTREHFAVLGTATRTFTVDNRWFAGAVEVAVYRLEELLGTKMRALYQRKKGRDMYDLWHALGTGQPDPDLIVQCFQRYMEYEGTTVSRAEFEANLAAKLTSKAFLDDIRPLIPADADYRPEVAAAVVMGELVARLPGEPWKGLEPQTTE
jgi:predicted nucleotidyltransferase component of viral defense system